MGKRNRLFTLLTSFAWIFDDRKLNKKTRIIITIFFLKIVSIASQIVPTRKYVFVKVKKFT